MQSKYDEIRNDAVIQLIGKIMDIAESCPDADTAQMLVDVLAEYNEKRWNCGQCG